MYGRTTHLAWKSLLYCSRGSSTRRMPGPLVRCATLEDYRGVMDIGDMYDGSDYLSYLYRDFIIDPHYRSYVCEVDKEIVGFACSLLHDDELAVQGRAGRVKPAHRGKGYLKLILQHILEGAGQLTTARSFISVKDETSINWAALPSSTSQVDSGIKYIFPMSRSKRSILYPFWTCVRINEADLRRVFDSPTACRLLFPRGFVYIHSLALGIYKSNIRHIVTNNTTMFVSTSAETKTSDNHGVKGKLMPLLTEHEDIRLLTIGRRYPVTHGHHCSITVFGNQSDTLIAHVQAHVKEAIPSCNLNGMTLYTAKDFPCEAIDDVFEQFGSDQLRNYDLCTLSMDLLSPMADNTKC